MDLKEATKILNDFIMYCRFNEERNYTDEQLFNAIEYFAFNKFIPVEKIKEKIKEYEELVEDFEKTDNSGRFKRTKSIDYYKLEAFKELLEDK